jgi:hypothetical protein
MQHGAVAGAAGELVQSSRLTSLTDDPDLKAADSGAPGDRGDHAAAGVVAAAGADVGADLDAQQAAWVAAAAAAVGAAASADASSNRGAHTKGDPHSSDPSSRRD